MQASLRAGRAAVMRGAMVRTAGVLAAITFLAVVSAAAQPRMTAGAERARERATYHFDNPSTFNTPDLVPHFFEQHYVLDNVWITASASYRLGIDLQTSIGATPQTQALATDYDTFFNPGQVVWVSGTTGDARVRSWRVSQALRLGRAGPVALTGGYRLRVDRADFLDGDRTVLRNGVLADRTVVTTREYTTAQRHEIYVGARVGHAIGSAWRLDANADVAPAAIYRLAIELPDKYPGRTLVYRTTALTVGGQVVLSHAWSDWTLALLAGAHGTVSYSATQRVDRSALTVGLTIGR
ncbi:MAG: hypothetical protein AB7Q29_09700 [Vicinamibacterales bacterium]